MLKLSDIKLKYQLIILVSVSIFMMIVVQSFYYYNFNALTRKKADIYFNKITEQMKSQILSYAKSIEGYSNAVSYSKIVQQFIHEEDSAKRVELMPYINDNLNKILLMDSNVQNIKVLDSTGLVLLSDSDDKYVIYNSIISDYNVENLDFKTGFYTKVYYDDNAKSSFFAYIKPIFSTNSFINGRIGINIILCKVDALQRIVNSTELSPDAVVALTDSDNTFFAYNNIKLKNMNLEKVLKNIIYSNNLDSGEVFYNNKKCLVQTLDFNDMGWKMAFLVPINDITNDLIPLRDMGFVLGIITLFAVSFIGLFLIRNITIPISRLISGLDEVGKDNIKFRLKVSGKNEVSIIAKDVNNMLERVEDLTNRILTTQGKLYNAEISKTQTELSALQSQINPHFLYNTLECIRSIGLYHGIEEITQISTSMAKIFRFAIKEQDIVTVRNELDCVNEYYNIMSIRYMGKYKLHMNVDDNVNSNKIIKMILQPIVENAFYHGLERKEESGNLYIRGYADAVNSIVIEISDDGKGMSEDELYGLRASLNNYETVYKTRIPCERRNIGLLNIYNRLRLAYGDNCSMEINSLLNEGTTIIIRIPSDTQQPYNL